MPAIRVLVADDERLIRKLVAYMLARSAGLEVVGEASNGREAVDLALRERPDVIVMDLNMPELNGVQATERILAEHPHIRVVMLTDLVQLAPMGAFSGAAACLAKNCAPEELVAAIRRVHAAQQQ